MMEPAQAELLVSLSPIDPFIERKTVVLVQRANVTILHGVLSLNPISPKIGLSEDDSFLAHQNGLSHSSDWHEMSTGHKN